MNNRQNDVKNVLVYILNFASHSVWYRNDLLDTLDKPSRDIAIKLDDLHDDFNKDNTVQLQMLNYLDSNVYRRKSDMKNMIKAFISYNSSNPEIFNIPPDSYINSRI